MAKKPLSREKLVARLKAIAADESLRIVRMGAMCYSASMPPEMHTACDICGCDIKFFEYGDDGEIIETVEKIKSLGYDAKVEEVCEACCDKLKMELYPNIKTLGDKDVDSDDDICVGNLNYIFYFRLSPDEEYHREIANDCKLYKALLAFLRNKPKFTDYYDNEYYIADEIETLGYMTGIKCNE